MTQQAQQAQQAQQTQQRNNVSPLATYTKLSPHRTARGPVKIDTITPHVLVAQWTAQRGAEYFATQGAQSSANYVVGCDGSIACCADEESRAWTTGGYDPKTKKPITVNGISGRDNDFRAITIEIASEKTPPYKITEEAKTALINLMADICLRHPDTLPELRWHNDKSLVGKPEQQNITVHRWFAPKSCPGDYVMEQLPNIVEQVNAKIRQHTTATNAAATSTANTASTTTTSAAKSTKKTPTTSTKTTGTKTSNPASAPEPKASPTTPTGAQQTAVDGGFTPYMVKVTASVLRIRIGPGINFHSPSFIADNGVYTIVEEAKDMHGNPWGKLKSGAGWIALNYTKRVNN